jgi:hypothetical protein
MWKSNKVQTRVMFVGQITHGHGHLIGWRRIVLLFGSVQMNRVQRIRGRMLERTAGAEGRQVDKRHVTLTTAAAAVTMASVMCGHCIAIERFK